jgi:hypothetical protein
MPITNEIITAEIKKPKAEPPVVHKAEVGNSFIGASVVRKDTSKKTSFKFPWWILPLLLFALLAFIILFMLKRKSRELVYNAGAVNVQPQIKETVIVPVPIANAVSSYTVNLDEEIRTRAYELSLQRCNGQGDYRDQDWYNAVREISAWYIACGHSVYPDEGSWWASHTVENSTPVDY